jgi:ribosomal protein S27AE
MTDPGNALPPGDKKAKSLREMAAEADIDPWACRNCGCRDWAFWPVESTYVVKGGTRTRRRVCRHCGQSSMMTDEIPRVT